MDEKKKQIIIVALIIIFVLDRIERQDWNVLLGGNNG